MDSCHPQSSKILSFARSLNIPSEYSVEGTLVCDGTNLMIWWPQSKGVLSKQNSSVLAELGAWHVKQKLCLPLSFWRRMKTWAIHHQSMTFINAPFRYSRQKYIFELTLNRIEMARFPIQDPYQDKNCGDFHPLVNNMIGFKRLKLWSHHHVETQNSHCPTVLKFVKINFTFCLVKRGRTGFRRPQTTNIYTNYVCKHCSWRSLFTILLSTVPRDKPWCFVVFFWCGLLLRCFV